MRQIHPAELAQSLRTASPEHPAPVILDVREAWEVQTAAITASRHVPMGEVTSRVGELDPDQPIVCLCHHGMRSLQVAMWLERQGFTDVSNLAGGIDAWSREVDSNVALY
jgi:hypothetical protein